MVNRIMRKLILGLAVISCGIAGGATATDHRVEPGAYQQVGGIDIYYGIVPARIAGQHPPAHEERKMHGGVPGANNAYHLIVALFEAGGKRITDASVTATVGEFGMAGTRKRLEPMRVADSTSFGNYFTLRKGAIYRISIEIRRPDKPGPGPVEALFDYRLQ